MDDIRSSRKRYLFLGEEGTGKTTTIKFLAGKAKPFLSRKAKPGINDLEFYEVTFEGHEIWLIDGKTPSEYKKHNPDNSEVDIAVLVLTHERLKSSFKETEMQIKDAFGDNFRNNVLFLILCNPQTSGDVAPSDETDDLICKADKSFTNLYKRYFRSLLTIELPHCGFLQTNDLFKNLIEIDSEKTKKNDRSVIKVVVIRDETEASLVSKIALSAVCKTDSVEFYDLENKKENLMFIDTPPLQELLANKEFFKDVFSKIDAVTLLIKESKMPMPTLFPKLENTLGQAFYDSLLIGINLLGKDSGKYNSIRDSVCAMMKMLTCNSEPRLFLLPDLAACSKTNLLRDITKISKSSGGKNAKFEKQKRCFVLIPEQANDPKESIMKEIDPAALCVEMGDTKLLEVHEDGHCMIFLKTPLMGESDMHKGFLQICKEGIHLIIVDKGNIQVLEYLQKLFAKDVLKHVHQYKPDPSQSQHLDGSLKMDIVHLLRTVSSPIKMQDCHVLFIGENGSGKSSSINTIVGRPVFTTGHIWSMKKTVTKDVQRYTYVNEMYKVAFGKNITLIDTPNFETLKRNQEFIKVIHSGIDVVVLVVKIDRLTPHRLSFFEKVPQLLTDKVFDHMIVVFTFAENLRDENIDTFLETGGQEIEEYMEKIQGRFVNFSNTSRDPTLLQQQQELFMRKLDFTIKSNMGNVLSTVSKSVFPKHGHSLQCV